MQVTVDDRGTVCVLPCGTVVEGRVRGEGDQFGTAEELGYGGDVLQMVKDHDLLHVRLCEWLGIGDSYSIREAAGLDADAELAAYEESAVLAVQKFMRHAGRLVP